MSALHPKVKAWLAEHRAALKERQEEIKRWKREGWGWEHRVLPDLTPRDLYRLRASSTLCHAMEAAGGKVKEVKIRGDLTFTVGGREIACTVVEKLTMGLSRAKGDAAWTAYPRSNTPSLGPSGFLRATITTWLPGKQPEWVETQRKRFVVLAPEIAAAIAACDARLTEWERERAEQEKRWREKEARRREEQRRREINDKRWGRFQGWARSWEKRDKLLAFIAELRRRLEAEGDAIVEERPLSEWIGWAEERAEALDPFRQGLCGLFEAVTRPDYSTYG